MNQAQKEVQQAQLDEERELIRMLKRVYGQAQDDCVNKLIDLSRRRDMENLQTIIHQQQYQNVVRQQIDAALDDLQNNEYEMINDYLNNCYNTGFVGTMYGIASQGIPIVVPVDQEQVVRAVQLESKINGGLYKRLGEDVEELKKNISFEVARGIANGSSWLDVGDNLAKHMKNTPFQKALNYSLRIARTEGHRIQNQAAMDAMKAAKEKGANVVKQWEATLDDRTRESHRLLDGQIRELDEEFELPGGKKAVAPGYFNDPAEDCNCRCALLQRARWALDESELEILKERAEYFELDKSDSFEEYEKKYLGISKEDIEINGKSSKIELKDDIEKINTDIKELEKQFSDITEGYSYFDWLKEFESIEDGYGELDSDGLKLKEIDQKIKDLAQQKSELLLQKEKRGQLDTGYSGKIPDDKIEEYNKKAFEQIKLDTGYSNEKAEKLHDALKNYFGGDYGSILTGETTTAEIIRNGIDRMPTYDGTIYRGMTFPREDVKLFSELKQGDILPQKGIIASWTSNERTSISFGGVQDYERSTVILECMDNKTGVGVQHISKFGDREAEVLSSANYEVVEVAIENKYDYLSKHKEFLYLPSDLEEAESDMKGNIVCRIKVKEKN